MRCLVSTGWELVEIVKRFPFFFRCFHFQNFVVRWFCDPWPALPSERENSRSFTHPGGEWTNPHHFGPTQCRLHGSLLGTWAGARLPGRCLDEAWAAFLGCFGKVWSSAVELLTSSYQLVAPMKTRFFAGETHWFGRFKRLSFAGRGGRDRLHQRSFLDPWSLMIVWEQFLGI